MRRHLVFGMLAGWALWAVLFAITYVILERGTAILPESGVFRRILHWITVAAMPIAIGGWAYIWGDGPGQRLRGPLRCGSARCSGWRSMEHLGRWLGPFMVGSASGSREPDKHRLELFDGEGVTLMLRVEVKAY